MRSAPFPIAKLEHSDTAKAKGIDNTIPADLLPVARGLGVVAGLIEGDLGERVTGAFRSHALTAEIYKQSRFSKHVLCEALDIGGDPGPDTPARLEGIARKLRAHPTLGPVLASTFVEHDHLHTEWEREALIALGTSQGQGST